MLTDIPAELKALPNWVAWKLTPHDSGKPTKVPISPVTGKGADSTDPSTWASFDQTLAYAAKHNLGIGFMFGNSPYVGIDLDATDDETIREFHRSVEHEMCSYSEISPSGAGLHIIVKGSIPENRRDRSRAIELYGDKRYFTVTGNVYRSSGISSPNGSLDRLWSSLGGKPAVTTQVVDMPRVEDNTTILARAGSASNSELFKRLWDGDISLHNNDHSAADQALMNILGFYTQNQEQIRELFHMSNLGQRKKAHRVDYITRTVDKALDQFGGAPVSIELASSIAASATSISIDEAREDNDIIPADWAMPPGLVGEIARYVYLAAPRPVQEIALAASLGLMSGITGRQWNVSNTGLNQYVLVLARTGSGKEAAATGIDKLMSLVKNQVPSSSSFIGPAEIASGAALFKYLGKESQCFVSVVGEFGLTLQRICAPFANESLKGLRKLFLDLYHKSGEGSQLHPLIYSQAEKSTPTIAAPAFSLLGESTPETFYNHLDDSMIAEGLIPRFTILEYTGPRPALNEQHSRTVPDDRLVGQLIELALYSTRLQQQDTVITVGCDDTAYKAHMDFERLATSKINSADTGELSRQLWNRAHIKSLKLAAVLAVGENMLDPRISLSNFEWARLLITRDIDRIETRFKQGRTGVEETEVNQMRMIVETMKLFRRMTDGSKTDRLMRVDGVVPMSFFQKRLLSQTAFRRDKFGALGSLKRGLEALASQGRIAPLTPAAVQAKYSSRCQCYALLNSD